MGQDFEDIFRNTPGYSLNEDQPTDFEEQEQENAEEGQQEQGDDNVEGNDTTTTTTSSEETTANDTTATDTTTTSKKEEDGKHHWSENYYESEDRLLEERKQLTELQTQIEGLKSIKEVADKDEFIQGYLKTLENGGDVASYVQTQVRIKEQLKALDFDTMNQEETIKQAFFLESREKGIKEEYILADWEEYKADAFDAFGEEGDFDRDRKVERAYLDAKPKLQNYKETYSKKLGQPLSNPNQQQQPTPEQIAAQQAAQAEEDRKFKATYDKEVPLEYKFKDGDKEVVVKSKGNLFKSVENQFNKQNLLVDYTDDKGNVSWDKYLQDMHFAKNRESILASVYKQAQQDYEAQRLETARHPKPTDASTQLGNSALENNLAEARKWAGE